MQATAKLRYLLMSPRKVRRVVELVKGKSVEEALNILKFTNKAAAEPLSKTIQSATANALAIEGTSRLKAEDLSIANIRVDEGPRAKRIRYQSMGRVFRYNKRFSHVTVVVEGTPREEVNVKKRSVSKKQEETGEGKTEAETKPVVKKSAGTKTVSKKAKSGNKKAKAKKQEKKSAAATKDAKKKKK